MIEDYNGGAAWNFAVGTGGDANAHVAGLSGGLGGSTCSDGELVTAQGLASGFTQPGPMGCWTHQGYDRAFFGSLGFGSQDFFDSSAVYAGLGSGSFSSFLTRTIVIDVIPEPSSFVLLCFGGLTLIGYRCRKRAA
jgi:hypothetical protein